MRGPPPVEQEITVHLLVGWKVKRPTGPKPGSVRSPTLWECLVREQFALHLGARGRLVLPAPIRKRLGLKEGDRLVLTLEPDGTLRLASLREQVKKLRGLLKNLAPGRSLVDELIRDRRAEAARE